MFSRTANVKQYSESGSLNLTADDPSSNEGENQRAQTEDAQQRIRLPAGTAPEVTDSNTSEWYKPSVILSIILSIFVILSLWGNIHQHYQIRTLESDKSKIHENFEQNRIKYSETNQLKLDKVGLECKLNTSNLQKNYELKLRDQKADYQKDLQKERYEFKLKQLEYQYEKKINSYVGEIQNFQLQMSLEQNRTFQLQELYNQRKECYEDLQKCQLQCHEKINAWKSEIESVYNVTEEYMVKIEAELRKCKNRDLSEYFSVFAGSIFKTLGKLMPARLIYGGNN